ncbi:MAG: hypothetical protein R6U27_07395 [Desulfobacterales bacterium]
MKDPESIKKKDADPRENNPEVDQKPLRNCKNKILNLVYDPRGGTLESFFQHDYHRLVVKYYFGKSNALSKGLYCQIMGQPKRYG